MFSCFIRIPPRLAGVSEASLGMVICVQLFLNDILKPDQLIEMDEKLCEIIYVVYWWPTAHIM